MYRKKEHLKQLVHSLSMSEKRYFSLFTKAFAGQEETPYYARLYYSLTKSKSVLPDESENPSVQIKTNAAKRLYENILKGLLLYHQDSSVDITIQTLLSKIEILYRLALPEQCQLLLNKAYKLASQHEKFGLLLHILQWEHRLNIILDNPPKRVEDIAEEEQQVLGKLEQITHLVNIYSKARALKRQAGYVNGENKYELALNTIKAPKMPALEECTSQRARYYHYFVHALYYTMIYDHRQAYLYSKKLLSSPVQSILPNNYIDGILEHVTSCICLGYFDEALSALHISDAYIREQKIDQSDSFNVLIFYYKISACLIIYNYIGDRQALYRAIAEAEEKLQYYDKKLSIEMKQVILGNLRNAYVGVGEIDRAENIMEKLFRKESKLVRKEIYDDLYLFRLFSLLQTQTYVLLPPMALSAYRYYKQQDNKDHFNAELQITALLVKEHDYDKAQTTRSILQEIKQILIQHLSRLEGTNNFQEYYSFYIIWADSMFHGRPFYEQARVWHEQHVPHWQ